MKRGYKAIVASAVRVLNDDCLKAKIERKSWEEIFREMGLGY